MELTYSLIFNEKRAIMRKVSVRRATGFYIQKIKILREFTKAEECYKWIVI